MQKQNDSLRNVNVRLLEQERQRLHRTLDVQYDKFVREVLTDGHPELIPEGECLWSLEDSPGRFKGKKVTGIWLRNGEILTVRTWKETAVELLRECKGSAYETKVKTNFCICCGLLLLPRVRSDFLLQLLNSFPA